MNPLLYCAIGLVREWTRFYTLQMAAPDRDRRRDEIESDLWEFHEDARRRGYPPAAIALHMLARLAAGIPDDLRWRVEYEGEAPMSPRRSTWLTVAAIGATVSVGALWAFFAAISIGALPPLPDSVHIERVYLHALPPPPPPPPLAQPAGLRVPVVMMPPPPPPPPPR
jgi:hypothetical protein